MRHGRHYLRGMSLPIRVASQLLTISLWSLTESDIITHPVASQLAMTSLHLTLSSLRVMFLRIREAVTSLPHCNVIN